MNAPTLVSPPQYLPEGTVIKVAGKRYLITGQKSKVNWTGVLVNDDDTFGGKFNIPTRGKYDTSLGVRHDLLSAYQGAKPGILGMGTTVRVTSGKFAGRVGIIGQVRQTRYLIATPGEQSILVPVESDHIEVVNLVLIPA